MTPKLAAATAAAALTCTPVVAQTIEAWDANQDGALTELEVRQGVGDAGVFERWDLDGDDRIAFGELSSGIFDLWDADDDGELSVDEWDDAVDLWFGEEPVDLSVAAWDENGDNVISRPEFEEALGATNLLARLDTVSADEMIAEDEFAAGLFDIADRDDDEALVGDEDSLLTDIGEFFSPDEASPPEEQEGALDPSGPTLLERGEAFVQLPVPCAAGEGQTDCSGVAQRFCSALGYGEPLDFLDVGGELYAIRCRDDL